ncbi:MAG: outer membrane beta-barrel protein [Ignavibacteriaceae bacterium]|jgi:hypothetical protein|nr:MAG: hypothetical protein UZ04_CHB001002148 [Chlorobi bacterium OLB4]MBW7856668.1 outer membrane beta-barrel protein [Ignavibacteria bacterium]MEB2330625.1 outer membrane beta-barrel protein [Ignavibacteriaceae bacterium]OQY77190.1 MAG: hypothetical protein B6D43_07640 [Ignavibacteriales bacterium UTCHB1]
MKNLFYFSVVLLMSFFIISNVSNAQTSPVKVTVYGGGTLPVGSFGDANNASGNVGVDIQYTIDKNWSVYGNGAYNFLAPKTDGVSSHIIEATVGPRYTYNFGGASFIGEVGAGIYSSSSSVSTMIGDISASSTDFGINGGAGLEVPISPIMNFVGKVKFHNIFTEGSSTSYMGGYAGVNYRF